MARNERLPPSAACLSASMRDLGYSLETAVADLVDNSISAEASSIDIICDLSQAIPILAVIDNGDGMDTEKLHEAMRHGAANPKHERSVRDLGRFGLGLKTASLSQCRSLVVVSKKRNALCGAEWNLDLIDSEDDWLLSILDDEDLALLPYVEQLKENGTVVLWRHLDRLLEDQAGSRRDEVVNEKLDILERHLSLVFHRYIAGEVKGWRKIAITVNGHPIEAFDPFCRKNSATQILPEEIVHIGSSEVRMQPYILPHHSRLSSSEHDLYQNRSDFISNQGAYIYRNGRLMAWGDWFRLIPKGEATKLARVQIDFPNSLDESWTIDIKKSRARPPHPVRERLRQIISKVSGRSTTVHRGRGQRLFEDTNAPVWDRYADHGGIRYALNTTHPLVQNVYNRIGADGADHLSILIEVVSASLPVEMIYSDYSTHARDISQSPSDQVGIKNKLRALRSALSGDNGLDANKFREIVRSVKLFDNHMDIAETFIREEF
jgi:Histidine kinase-, DNA gyrase B-, and HSP90-like ATPase